MAVPQRTALTLPDPRGVSATIELAKWAEAEGYDDLWFADSGGAPTLCRYLSPWMNVASPMSMPIPVSYTHLRAHET